MPLSRGEWTMDVQIAVERVDVVEAREAVDDAAELLTDHLLAKSDLACVEGADSALLETASNLGGQLAVRGAQDDVNELGRGRDLGNVLPSVREEDRGSVNVSWRRRRGTGVLSLHDGRLEARCAGPRQFDTEGRRTRHRLSGETAMTLSSNQMVFSRSARTIKIILAGSERLSF